MELGPKDLEAQAVVLARRDIAGAREPVAWADVAKRVPELLEEIQVRRGPSSPSDVATPKFLRLMTSSRCLQWVV